MHAPATQLLREGLLEGCGVLLLSAAVRGQKAPGEAAAAVREGCEALGARVEVCTAGSEACRDEAAMDALVERALAQRPQIDVLVVDGGGLYAAGAGAARAGDEGSPAAARAALADCMQGSWNAIRAVVNRAFLPRSRGGRLLLLAPAACAGEHAPAARAGLENLARTLSVEWARHGLTAVAIWPGPDTAADELATLVAYVASPAGAYMSGCLLDLG